MPNVESHQRILDTFTGPVEKPILRWLANRMPSWVTSDMLTVIGTVGAVITFLGYWLTNLDRNFLWLASFGFVVNWFGDSLDGTLARCRHTERPRYGFFVDHMVDVFNEVMIFLGLGMSPYMRFDLACLALIGYLLLSIMVYISIYVLDEFKLSYGKLGPTEARLIAICANTVIFFIGNPTATLLSWTLTVYEWIGIAVILLLVVIVISGTIRQVRILSRLDPPPGPR
ncbi:MAG: CDP-alcohol phosphatidyltransferase family protein [Anaerolineales bacterium]|nr:CDP-alcohol phosphatidyltransferase family protein [Anaerolineales bacterium]